MGYSLVPAPPARIMPFMSCFPWESGQNKALPFKKWLFSMAFSPDSIESARRRNRLGGLCPSDTLIPGTVCTIKQPYHTCGIIYNLSRKRCSKFEHLDFVITIVSTGIQPPIDPVLFERVIYFSILPGIGHDFNVLGISRADCGPMDSFNPTARKHIRPTNSKIYINYNFHDRRWLSVSDFTAFGKPCGVLKGLQNILALKIGIINQQFFNRFPCANLGEYPAHRQAHTPNTGLATHYTGVIGYAIKMFKRHFQLPSSSKKIAHYAFIVEGTQINPAALAKPSIYQ
jgi:hypothetical protein